MDEATTTVSPQDIQSKLTAAISYLEKTTISYSAMVKKYGTDWSKWPQTTNWWKAFNNLTLAGAEVLACTYSEYGVSVFNKG